MMYKLGTLEQYLIENPLPVSQDDESQTRKWTNPKKEDEHLWVSQTGTITEEEKFDIVSVWTNAIIKPTSKKYYINNKNSEYMCGVVEVGQVMTSGFNDLEVFNSEEHFLSKCEELGISFEE